VILIVIFIRFRESFWVACTWWELAATTVANKPKVNAASFDELNIFGVRVVSKRFLPKMPSLKHPAPPSDPEAKGRLCR